MNARVTLLLLLIIACSPQGKPQEESEPLAPNTEQAKGSATEAKTEVGGQSFRDGIVALCQSYTLAPKSDDPIEAQKLLHAFIGKTVTNEKVRELFTLIGDMPPKQRPGMLHAAAAKAGVTTCALAGEPAAP